MGKESNMGRKKQACEEASQPEGKKEKENDRKRE